MRNKGLSFTEWHASGHNPLRGSSQIAQHFTKDALLAAFQAGMLYQERLTKDRRQADRDEPNNFSFAELGEAETITGKPDAEQ